MTTLLWDGSSALYTLGGALVEAPGLCCCLPPSSSSGSSSGPSGSGSGSGTSGSGTSGSGSSGYPCEFNEDCEYWNVDVYRNTSPCYICSGDECIITTCPDTTCLPENDCYSTESECNEACGPTNPEDTGCTGDAGPFSSYEEANQYVNGLDLPEECEATIVPFQGYCCNGQCSPTSCCVYQPVCGEAPPYCPDGWTLLEYEDAPSSCEYCGDNPPPYEC